MKILMIAVMSLMLATTACAADAKTEKLTVVSKDGTEHYFNVEIAATPVDREVGLMFRTSMDPNHGMLFEMDANATVEFWMKDTLIPLDMLFVAADGTIKTIHENAIPKDLTPLSSKAPVTGVIELNGGRAAALGIAPGDKVVVPFFGSGKK
jgi:uncharacterized membrane protein (UPF0127 family)